MNKSTATRLGQILLDKGLITAEQLDIAVKEQQKRRQLLDPFDSNPGVNSSLGEILIELGFIDRLQLKRGLNWQLMLRKMAIVMSFCAPLMTASVGAAAGTSFRPSFTTEASSSSAAAKVTPSFTKTSSSVSSAPASNSVSSPAKLSSSSSSKSSVSSLAASSSSKAPNLTGLKIAEVAVVFAYYDHVQLSWTPSPDDENITGYKIFRDQVEIDALDSYRRDYDDFNVAAGRTYLYGVSVGDAAGNWSPIKSIFVQTEAAPKGVEVKSSSSASSVASSQASANNSVSNSSLSNSSSPNALSSSSKAASSVASSASSKSATSSSPVSSAASSTPVTSNSSSSVTKSSAASSNANSSSSGLGEKASTVAGPTNFSWVAPALRENGSSLDITEVGGYEFRYRKLTDTSFTYVTINDAWKNYHNFTWLEGTFIFQVAAFDKNGLYSNFVDIAPQ